MSKNKFFFILSVLSIISIFTFIYAFSLKNIINLWTYSEVHLNYSQGFIRRGLFGEILFFLNSFGIKSNISFSTIFYLFHIINAFLFLKILNKITNNYWYRFYFIFNPAFIFFSFYDLGGYARSEVFGIFLILLHTIIFQKVKLEKFKLSKYFIFYYLILYPSIILSFLIHEINIFFVIFHIILTFKVLQTKKIIEIKIIAKSSLPILILLYFLYLSLSQTVTPSMLQDIYKSLPNNENISLWIWEALLTPISDRSEFAYMANPFTNIIYYFLITIFYLIPIVFFLNKLINKQVNHYLYLLLSLFPFFILFFIARDWGRWIHIIFMIIFCYYGLNVQETIKNFNFKKIFIPFVVIFLIFQVFFTRIPHCCNLVEKNISIIGGFASKVLVLNNLIYNKIDVEKRFKKF